MVLISEIMEGASKKEDDPKELDADAGLGEAEKTIQEPPKELEKTEGTPQEPPSSAAEPTETLAPLQPQTEGPKPEVAPPPETEADAEPGKALQNEYALRVAYIMRSYLHMRPGGEDAASSGDGGGAGDAAVEDRCRAMMEVVRKDNGRWSVSRVILEHTHPLNPPPDPAGTLASGGLVPIVGMEFESISTAKAYYGAYCEKMGFETRTGSGKRSRGNRRLILQRFLCSKGHSPAYSAANNALRKRKRASAKTTTEKAAKVAKNDEEVELIEVESSTEKAKIVNDDKKGEVQSGQPEEGALLEYDQNSAEGGKRGKAPLASNQGKSRLLRELGVRVSRYTNEERKNIILKYMQKRSNRQVVDRSIKVPSRQALAERRQRGVGGKFLSKEETQCRQLNQELDRKSTDQKDRTHSDNDKTPSSPKSPKDIPILNRLEETTEEEPPELPEEVVANANGVPIVGMVFENEGKAYDYYIKYAGSVGFSVRKGALERSVKHGTRSRVYVCSKEGVTNTEVKKKRPETRTGCLARMAIRVTSNGRYRITEFVPDHNHQLIAPLNIQMLSSQKILKKIQHGGCKNASAIPSSYKNYLRAKRPKDMQVGDAGALLEYLQKMKSDNPSFYYAIQVDEYDQMTNIFWADAKSMMDYYYFGDVLCFDTTYKANDYGRPFALFVGVNHHKQIIIFGAAFLYDETLESFKWLFESFNTAMSGKQPKTIFTDRCVALSDAIASVWPDTVQGLCVYQIYQNAVRQLDFVFQGSESFAHDFSHCLYDLEDEEEFLVAWKLMVEKHDLQDNEWLGKLYEEKDKWAPAYTRHTFSADMKSTLRIESLSSLLKEHLNMEKDLSHFLKLYEVLLEERRYAELQADYHASQLTSRIPPMRFLWQAAHVYTPAVFEIFRREFDFLLECIVYSCGEVGTLSEYQVTNKEKIKSYFVRFDSSDCSAICTCRKFECTGIQCCHVLKILDLKNFKELPPQYVLRRWRKDAKTGNLRENNGVTLESNLTSALSKRYSSLCRILFKIAARAAENVDTFMLMVNHSDQLLEQVERILQTRLVDKSSVTNSSKDQPDNLVEAGNAHHDNGSETQKHNGKKKTNGSMRRKHQNDSELNKRQKARKGQADELEVAPRESDSSTIPSQPRNPSNPFLGPNQFIQGPFVTPHQFGVGTAQGFHHVTQFGQDSSAPTLQQQSFHGSSHLAQGFQTADIHALQFIGSNPQMDHQNSDQGQCAIPVWDFL